MHNKTVIASYALIGAAVLAGHFYTKKLERDVKRNTKMMEQDRIQFVHDITNLGK